MFLSFIFIIMYYLLLNYFLSYLFVYLHMYLFIYCLYRDGGILTALPPPSSPPLTGQTPSVEQAAVAHTILFNRLFECPASVDAIPCDAQQESATWTLCHSYGDYRVGRTDGASIHCRKMPLLGHASDARLPPATSASRPPTTLC